MPSKKGTIVLMGSGELTATMVEVHKELLAKFSASPQAVFLDTPAGFQLNVDRISQKAVEYFKAHVQQPMAVASYRSNQTTSAYEAEKAFHTLREADYILIGPGSPTYAVRQLQQTPVPEILIQRIEAGACLVAASAAALTVGRFTLPVYEIYKVGQDLHWTDGMDILGHFGFNLVVIPHWNNAEGGTHDTRCCFMGQPRFTQLESSLPEEVRVFGLDEHTACIMDLEKGEAVIRGIGRAILHRPGSDIIFEKGDRFSLEILRKTDVAEELKTTYPQTAADQATPPAGDDSFWDNIHKLEAQFHKGLESYDPKDTTIALLELDRTIWQAQQNLENEEFVTQAREILRDLIVLLGTRLESSPRSKADCLAPLVDGLIDLREKFRQKKQWQAADAIRDSLQRADIILEDTQKGCRWRLSS